MSEQEEPAQAEVNSDNDLTSVLVPLLKGVVYQEGNPARWNNLLMLQAQVREYVVVLGLALHMDESEGYAFLRSRTELNENESDIPRLVVRRPLSFPVSLLLALLRKKLTEHDASGGEPRLILSLKEIVELIRVFLPEGSNEVKLIDQIETHLNKAIELGFVRKLRGQTGEFEVRRIIKTFIDAQWLAEFDRRLADYRALLDDSSEGDDDE